MEIGPAIPEFGVDGLDHAHVLHGLNVLAHIFLIPRGVFSTQDPIDTMEYMNMVKTIHTKVINKSCPEWF